METKELLKKVKKIEIKTRRLSNHLFSGHYHSSFKGRGVTFSEVRPYQYGDDFRAIDWNVTARNNDTYIKVFEEERELTLLLMVDCSASQSFGSSLQNKNEIIAEIAATLAFSATQNNDKIGLVLFSDQVELFIPPKKGKTHVLRIIRELVEWQPKSSKTAIHVALEFVSQVMKKKAILFLISDFRDSNYQKSLQIAAKKHDVTGIRVYDKREQHLPNLGLVSVVDAETNAHIWLDTQSPEVRHAYENEFKIQEAYCFSTFSKCGAGLVNTHTEESYVSKLLTYFKSRS
jgi:uncharacterized protein (DUF58 family)